MKEYRDIRYNALKLDNICRVHQYRYYVMNKPIISDRIYDLFEKEAKNRGFSISVGSSLKNNYSKRIRRIAHSLDTWYNNWYLSESKRAEIGLKTLI